MASHPKRRRPLKLQSLESRNLFAADFELFDTVRVAGLLNEVVTTADAIYFVKEDLRHGSELWRADRDGGNAALFKDIATGPKGSTINSLTIVGRQLFFTADDGIHGRELWTSDGTSLNTRMVVDLTPGPASGFQSDLDAREPIANVLRLNANLRGLLFIDHQVFFGGSTDGESTSLWVSDGTAQGTSAISPPAVEDFVQSEVVQAFVRGDRVLYVQRNISTSSESPYFTYKYILYTGSQEEGFLSYDDIEINPTYNQDRPIKLIANLLKGTLFSIDETVYSLTEAGIIERFSDTSLVCCSYNLPISSDGYAVFTKSSSSGPNLDVFRTDGTSEGTDKFSELELSERDFSTDPLLLSRDVFVTNPGYNTNWRALVTLSEQPAVQRIDYAPQTRDIETYAISETSFVTFEIDRFVVGGGTHLLRLIDVEQETSRLLIDIATDEAIAQVVKYEQSLYLTIASKDAFRVVELSLEDGAADLTTVATFPVVNGFESVELKLIDGSLFIEYVSTARTELLMYQTGVLRLISTIDVGHPGWRDFYFPVYSYSGTLTDDRFVKGNLKTFHSKTISSVLSESGKLSPFSQNYVDLGVMPHLRGSGYRSGLYHIGESVLYFVNSSDLGLADARRHTLFIADALGNTTELFSVSANRLNGGSGNTVTPLGSFQDRFYFAAFMDDSWSLFRTNENQDGVELISEAFAGAEIQQVRNLTTLSRTSRDRNHDVDRIVIVTEIQPFSKPLKVLDFDFESQELHIVLDYQDADLSLMAAPRFFSGTGKSLWLDRNDRKNLKVEIGQTRVLRDFFTASQLIDLNTTFGANEVPIRIDDAWILFVSDSTGGRSLWRFSDSSDSAIKLAQFPQATSIYSVSVVAVTEEQVLFQIFGSADLWAVDGQFEGVRQVTNGATGEPIHMLIRAPAFGSSGDQVLIGGISDLYTISESGDSLNLLGTLPLQFQVRSVEQDGQVFMVFGYGTRNEVYRLVRNIASIPSEASGTRFAFGSDESGWILTNEDGTRSEFAKQSTGAIRFDDFDRPVEFSIDLGINLTSAIPLGGITLTLAADSTLNLTGATKSNVVYAVSGDSLEIQIGERKILVHLRGNLKIDDKISGRTRTVVFDDVNDDVLIQLDAESRTQLIDNNRKWSVSFPAQSLTLNVSNDVSSFHTKIDTGSGIDRVTISPSFHGVGQLEITSGLDVASRLSLSLPKGLSPPERESINGRSFQQLLLGSMEMRAEITNRPNHNLANPADADGDGSVYPLDALRIINYISRQKRAAVSSTALLYGDVNGDSQITALDALLVINMISRLHSRSEGEAILVPAPSNLNEATDAVFYRDETYYQAEVNEFLF